MQRHWRPLMTNALPEFDPSRTALLLMDFQHAMVGALGDEAGTVVVANAVAALEWARANNIPCGTTRVGFEPKDAADIPDINKAFAPVRSARILLDRSPQG